MQNLCTNIGSDIGAILEYWSNSDYRVTLKSVLDDRLYKLAWYDKSSRIFTSLGSGFQWNALFKYITIVWCSFCGNGSKSDLITDKEKMTKVLNQFLRKQGISFTQFLKNKSYCLNVFRQKLHFTERDYKYSSDMKSQKQ